MEEQHGEVWWDKGSDEIVQAIIEKLAPEVRASIDPTYEPLRSSIQITNSWIVSMKANIVALHRQISARKRRLSVKDDKAELNDFIYNCERLSKNCKSTLSTAKKLGDSRTSFLEIIDGLLRKFVDRENQRTSKRDLSRRFKSPSQIQYVIETFWQRSPYSLNWRTDDFVTGINELFEKHSLSRFDKDMTSTKSQEINENLRVLVLNGLKLLSETRKKYEEQWKASDWWKSQMIEGNETKKKK